MGLLHGDTVKMREPHLNADTKDVVRLGTGLIATLSALVLGLLIASAQGSFQTQNTQIKQITANVILLDNILARSGPEAQQVRVLLRSAVKTLVERIWREPAAAPSEPFEASTQSELFFDKLLALTPQNDAQRQMQAKAIQIGIDLAQTRVLFAQSDGGIPKPFVAVLVFWLAMIFLSFGLFARPNLTIVAALLVCALSATSAIFLILELSHPFLRLDGHFQCAIEQRACTPGSLEREIVWTDDCRLAAITFRPQVTTSSLPGAGGAARRTVAPAIN